MRFPALFPLALILALPVPALAQEAGTAANAPRVLVVEGTGEASAKPDRARLEFTVLRNGETARAALDEANRAMQSVIDGMRSLGAGDKDLQTAGFTINPQYRYDNGKDGQQKPPEIVGYEVRNSLTVTVRDIAKVGAFLDKAVSLGVNQGGDITFDLSDPKAVRDAARKKAVADARSTAEVLAEAAGVKLGLVREISEASAGEPPRPYPRAMKMMAADAAPSVPVETGENSFRESVRMVFEIGG
ncbi:SIMPL domain-containing protein [Jiella sp. M17.18]|uniref:SIMPL domain-containing protein n=1 Tax=Jiella sp. M17.18 TaxID=3234247 RepID=UPI0034DFD54E